MFATARSLFFLNLIHCSITTTEHCHPGTNSCYWETSTSSGWSAGRTACQSEGGDLAVIETEELFNFVLSEFGSTPERVIGLSDAGSESDFRWVNHAPLYYNRWAPAEPDGKTSQNCVKIDGATQKFADISCSAHTIFLCSRLAENCTDVKAGCTTFPIAHQGKITGPYPAAVFNTAKSNCEDLGQKLLTIDSQEEEDSLSSLITQDTLLGITDAEVETVFRRTDGFVSPWMNWQPGEPNGDGGDALHIQDCIARSSASSQWIDTNCNIAITYYCEAPKTYINSEEETTTILIDNNSTTCVQLPGSDGCTRDKISVETPWADRTVNSDVTTENIPCDQLMVTVKLTWDSPYGSYKKCTLVTMDTISVAKYNCHYVCDVTDAATTQIKLLSKVESSNNPAICDIKVY